MLIIKGENYSWEDKIRAAETIENLQKEELNEVIGSVEEARPIQFEKIMKLLLGKEIIIKEICSIYNLDTFFEINIFMENGDRPEMILTKDIISFLASINAEVGFDLYID